MHRVKKLLSTFDVVFWDFDGVVKDSVTVKTEGYEKLFLLYGDEVAGRVIDHHEAHGGVSRYEKIPLYLGWAGEVVTDEKVREFCERFALLVHQAVIDAPWVGGVREYLQAQHDRQYFVLVTATPQDEIESILRSLEIDGFFREVHGAPKPKTTAIGNVLGRLKCSPSQALMVGDADSDLKAAEANNVPFLLRRTRLNESLQRRYSGPMFDELSYE